MQNSEISRLPSAYESFEDLRAAGKTYVDKTELIYEIASNGFKYTFYRPEHFGKSLLISTLESLFKYGVRDFEGLAIEKLWNDKPYNVVHLDFSQITDFTDREDFRKKFREHLIEQFRPLGFEPQDKDPRLITLDISSWLHQQPVNSLVYLIEEFDAPLLACCHDKDLFEAVQRIMTSFFMVVKSNDGCNAFLFMTGTAMHTASVITCEFNVCVDLTYDNQFSTLLGFTEEEIKSNFRNELEHAADVTGLSSEALLDKLRESYGGYSFGAYSFGTRAASGVYCPHSVLSFLRNPENGFIDYRTPSKRCHSAISYHLRNYASWSPECYAADLHLPESKLTTYCITYPRSGVNIILTETGYLTIASVSEYSTLTLAPPNDLAAQAAAELYAEALTAARNVSLPSACRLEDSLSSGNAKEVFEELRALADAVNYDACPVESSSALRGCLQILLIGALKINAAYRSPWKSTELEVKAGTIRWIFAFAYAGKQDEVSGKLQETADLLRNRPTEEAADGMELRRLALAFCAEDHRLAACEEVLPPPETQSSQA